MANCNVGVTKMTIITVSSYSGTSLFQLHLGPAKVAGLVRWPDLREILLIQPYHDKVELVA